MELEELYERFEELKRQASHKELTETKSRGRYYFYNSLRLFALWLNATYSEQDLMGDLRTRLSKIPYDERAEIPGYEVYLRIANLWDVNAHKESEKYRLAKAILFLTAFLNDILISRHNFVVNLNGDHISSFSANSFYGLCGGRIFSMNPFDKKRVRSEFEDGIIALMLADIANSHKTNLMVFSDAKNNETYSASFTDGGPATKIIEGVKNFNTNNLMNVYWCDIATAEKYADEKLSKYGITKRLLDYGSFKNYAAPRNHVYSVSDYYSKRLSELSEKKVEPVETIM